MKLCLQYKWGIYDSYKKNCKLHRKLCKWHVCLWEPVNPGSKDGPEFHISSLENQLHYECLWGSGIQALAVKQFCLASVLTSFAPRVLWRSWRRLVVPELIYSNDLTDETSCIFWFTELRLCLPVWIRQTSYMRIIPRYHIGAFSVQGWSCGRWNKLFLPQRAALSFF